MADGYGKIAWGRPSPRTKFFVSAHPSQKRRSLLQGYS